MQGAKHKKLGRPRKTPSNYQADWTAEEVALMARLIIESPVVSGDARAGLARRLVEADRQCRQLDAAIRTSDEQRSLNNAHKNYRALLDRLHVGEVLVDADADDDEPA